ncbi:MAG TPA: hypothetical protein VNV17_19370 [Solirubrobacteraceae bacterium]|nr:hypothetical protein [Solirubrobacteraceae bacterium]
MRLLVALGCGLALLVPAAAGAATGDPPANRTLSQATVQACQANSGAPACETMALADLNAARAAEGVGPMQLPGDFGTLTVPQQLLVLSNLERVDRGLAPVIGLSGPLDQDALTGAQNDADPVPSNPNDGTFSSNWEGGYGSPFEADFVWMYDDGFGSNNEDCTSPGDPGCWGHRHDILEPFPPPVVMGAADAQGQFGASQTELFVFNDGQTAPGQADAPLAPTWATIAATLPFAVAPGSLHFAPAVTTAPVTVSVSGENMGIAATLSAGADGWSVTPATCTVVAGSSCTFTVSAAPAATGTAATLTLRGPNGAQQVTLAKQGAATLRAAINRRTITAGTAATITGTLLRPAGVGAPGQVVALALHPGGAPIAHATTSAGGTASFRVSPQADARYWLAFAGNSTLGGTSAGPIALLVAPRITSAFAQRVVPAGHAARLTGRVMPAPGDRRLQLQRERRGQWHTIASARANHAGRFRFVIRQPARGATRYRVLLLATATHARATSATKTLRAR